MIVDPDADWATEEAIKEQVRSLQKLSATSDKSPYTMTKLAMARTTTFGKMLGY
jgi:hypothetical protein